ncbi:MAG: hypothetical protein ACI8RD_003091 [Bacillariaceae sp.]|jgi:hypothetical protein
MKLTVAITLMALGGANAFAPALQRSSSASTASSQLNLFGGGNKGGDAAAKGPGGGMMDQLAMFKKAQEMASKKQKLDEELAKEKYFGTAADGKVTVECKFSPSKNPMDPQPDYDAVGFDFDEEWYDSVTPEELSAAVKEAVIDGIEKTNVVVGEKYKILGEELAAMSQAESK